jgi:2-amino-4-hydroxy-6-hydroxymethyldihydropteridine diphosphokinase
VHTETTTAYLALGANLGDRLRALRTAVAGLSATEAIEVLLASPVYETVAHTLTPGERQPAYLNAVVKVRTCLAPEALLAVAHDLERRAGRRRKVRWMPRTLDLDLLVYGQVTRQDADLVIPHPRLGDRRFVLQPWYDLAPNLYVPSPFDATVEALLHRCPDPHVPVPTGYQLLQPYNSP